MTSQSILARALLLGVVSGLRSFMGVALISKKISGENNCALNGTPLALLANPLVSKALNAATAGEIMADKLPGIPARTQAGPLIGRAVLGAAAGAAIYAEDRKPIAAGAVAGAVAAVASAFAAYYLRRWLIKSTGLSDTVIAIGEDALALSLGQQALKG